MNTSLLYLIFGVTAVFILFLLFRPERGLYWRWQQARRLTNRVLSEDTLKQIYKAEIKGEQSSLESIAGTLNIDRNKTAALLTTMQTDGYLQIVDGRIQLTTQGREVAVHIIRAHRLWEHHLAEQTGVNEVDWHMQADQQEHNLSAADLDHLSNQLGNPTHDPHGDPIPTAKGELQPHGGKPLTTIPVDQSVRIVHIEDEPEIVYAQLSADGLYPGMIIRVAESTPERIRFFSNGDEHVLAPMLAANVSVVALKTAVSSEPQDTTPLTQLQPGETAEVVDISPQCRGLERRRFMDLGILRGTKITAEFQSPSNDPVAYRIRGALIALRQEQANLIKIKKVNA